MAVIRQNVIPHSCWLNSREIAFDYLDSLNLAQAGAVTPFNGTNWADEYLIALENVRGVRQFKQRLVRSDGGARRLEEFPRRDPSLRVESVD